MQNADDPVADVRRVSRLGTWHTRIREHVARALAALVSSLPSGSACNPRDEFAARLARCEEALAAFRVENGFLISRGLLVVDAEDRTRFAVFVESDGGTRLDLKQEPEAARVTLSTHAGGASLVLHDAGDRMRVGAGFDGDKASLGIHGVDGELRAALGFDGTEPALHLLPPARKEPEDGGAREVGPSLGGYL